MLIVVGIRDSQLSEKLQMDPDLTLEKAVTIIRQREKVKKQQGVEEKVIESVKQQRR